MKIHIIDDQPPEVIAKVQAMYSRTPKSVIENMRKAEKEPSKFLDDFYVGYGHASIGDCGTTTIFLEGVSMLFAKAIQDWPLYSGQETSSRYINMSEQEIKDPIGTDQSACILKKLMEFYSKHQDALAVHLREKYPIKKEEVEDPEKVIAYNKAIKARGFDIMRGFLPTAATTQLSWHTNLRQVHDHLALLVYHPLEEVSDAAKALLLQLKEKYPGSFNHKSYPEQEAYRKMLMQKHNYYMGEGGELAPDFHATTNILPQSLEQYAEVFETLPMKTEILPWFEELGSFTFHFPLDFGSFRDIQRHRNGVCRMPLLGTGLGFHEWYLEELPEAVRKEAMDLIGTVIDEIKSLEASDEIKQYYVPMGFKVACKVTYGLPAAIYTIQLRSSKTVHPTLRKVAHQMAAFVTEQFPMIKLHADLNKDDWDIRRGLQDIVKK